MLTLSNVKAHERTELTHWENRPFIGAWPQPQPHQHHLHQSQPQQSVNLSGVTKTLRKKKRVRTCFTDKQLTTLEEMFSNTKYVTGDQRKQLSESLRLEDKSIKIWFQNRRMKEKKANSESDSNSESFSENNTSKSSHSSDSNYGEKINYDIILKQREDTPVTENEVNTEESSDCRSPLDLSFDHDHPSELITNRETYVFNNSYPTEYYQSYGTGYYLQYQNPEYTNNIGDGSWFADANNLFY